MALGALILLMLWQNRMAWIVRRVAQNLNQSNRMRPTDGGQFSLAVRSPCPKTSPLALSNCPTNRLDKRAIAALMAQQNAAIFGYELHVATRGEERIRPDNRQGARGIGAD
jgi:hypothetical protein